MNSINGLFGLGLLAAGLGSVTYGAAPPPLPGLAKQAALELRWECDWRPPDTVNLVRIQPVVMSTNDVVSWAGHFHLTNEVEHIPAAFVIAPGIWIRDFKDPKNILTWSTVYWSDREMLLAYASGDVGFRWDIAKHEPLVEGVPVGRKAVALAVDTVRRLDVRCELARRFNGDLLSSSRSHATAFIRRESGLQEHVVQRHAVCLYQRVGDGSLIGWDGLGTLWVEFVSKQEVSGVEVKLVKQVETASVEALKQHEIERKAKERTAWAIAGADFGGMGEVEVIGADIVYPVVKGWREQWLRPFYRLKVRKPGQVDGEFVFVAATQ